jgi:hypothetical protein
LFCFKSNKLELEIKDGSVEGSEAISDVISKPISEPIDTGKLDSRDSDIDSQKGIVYSCVIILLIFLFLT